MLDFPGGSDGKESACNSGDPGSVPESGRFPGEGHGNPLQYSCLENPWTEEPGGLQFMDPKETDPTEQLTHTQWYYLPARGDISQRKIQPCSYFLLCQRLMWQERMRSPVFPSQLFYLHAVWHWQVIQPLWECCFICEMKIISAWEGNCEGQMN